jgi:glycosyltransferase involved in cell wall biosynthesis
LCKYLIDQGVDGEMLSIQLHDVERNSVVELNKLCWKRFKYKWLKKLRYSTELKKYLDGRVLLESYSIVHVHNIWNYIPFVAGRICTKFKNKLVVSPRGSLYPWSLQQGAWRKKFAWFFFQKKMLNSSSCIHATDVSEARVIRNLGISTPIAVIPNGINIDEYKRLMDKSTCKESLKLNTNVRYILFLSRIHPKKGLEFLVNAWVKNANLFKDWDLLIVGPDCSKKYLEEIKKSIKKHGLESRVFFAGMLTGIDRLNAFGASDLFVLPSQSENFGISIAEAMASKLPVITTQGTPWGEIEESNAGWWVDLTADNIEQSLTAALGMNRDELIAKGVNGYKLVMKYEWMIQAKKMKELYEYIQFGGDKPSFIFEGLDEI